MGGHQTFGDGDKMMWLTFSKYVSDIFIRKLIMVIDVKGGNEV